MGFSLGPEGLTDTTADADVGFIERINIINTNMSDNSSGFDYITNNSDGGGTTWSIIKDGIIYFSSTSGGHGGKWGYDVYLPSAGYWRIGGAVRITNTDGAVHPNTSEANKVYTHSFNFYVGNGPSTGTQKWNADSLGEGVRSSFVSSSVYQTAGKKSIYYATSGYEGVQKIYITDLYLERVR
jgi:hypothetical protein